MVVDLLSAYNTIICRPTLKRLRAIISTYHLMIKFLTGNEIRMMMGMCYVQGVDGKSAGKMVSTIYQLVDEYPRELKDARMFWELDPRYEIKRKRLRLPMS